MATGNEVYLTLYSTEDYAEKRFSALFPVHIKHLLEKLLSEHLKLCALNE